MKTLGLIGGMSWESTIPYYRQINQVIKQELGGLHSAKIVLVSVDFHEIEAMQRAGDWDAAGQVLAQAARGLPKPKRRKSGGFGVCDTFPKSHKPFWDHQRWCYWRPQPKWNVEA